MRPMLIGFLSGLLCTGLSLLLPLPLGATLMLGSAYVQAGTIDQDSETSQTKRRRRPGQKSPECEAEIEREQHDGKWQTTLDCARQDQGQRAPGAVAVNPLSPVPRLSTDQFSDAVPIPNRWRIVDTLGNQDRWFNSYRRNILKADKPVFDDWFVNLDLVYDASLESRRQARPAWVEAENRQSVINHLLSADLTWMRGDSVFRPPDWMFNISVAFAHKVVDADMNMDHNVISHGVTRSYNDGGIQNAYIDRYLATRSSRFDFDSLRIGLQSFNLDFRGFLLHDNVFGLRLYGTRKNNIFQYNLALLRSVEEYYQTRLKNLAAGLRNETMLLANLYWQDSLAPGFTTQFSLVYVDNRESTPPTSTRPALSGYRVGYMGLSGDGHFGRLNTHFSSYLALGKQEVTAITRRGNDIQAYFLAAELSMDFDWVRLRASLLLSSGDDDPGDQKSQGFDTLHSNPQFAGSNAGIWASQVIALIAETGQVMDLTGRNSLLNNLRFRETHLQANFDNPGLRLLGIGADLDILPQLRLSTNVNRLAFDNTSSLQALTGRRQIHTEIGTEFVFAGIYRPFMNQNFLLKLTYSTLLPGRGYRDLFHDDAISSVMINMLLAY